MTQAYKDEDLDIDPEQIIHRPVRNEVSRYSAEPWGDDVAIIPTGSLDPVYEAKATILNRAVGANSVFTLVISLTCISN